MGYKKIAIKGIGWMGILHFLVKGISVIKIIVIARFLTPYDLGIYGISFLVLSLFETFSEFSLGAFIIQSKDKIEKYVDSIFFVQLLRGVILMVLVVIAAVPISYFFGDTNLILILIALSLVPVIKSFENPYIVLFQKELYFKKEFQIRLLSFTIDLLITAIAVLIFKSIFGAILGFIFATAIYIVLSWLVVKRHPGVSFDREKVLRILQFARTTGVLGIVTYVATRIDAFLIGRFAGVAVLGGYQFAQRISFEIMNDSSAIVGKVTFPIYSKIGKGNKKRLRKAFLRSFYSVLAIEGIFAVFVILFSKPIILIAGGNKWLAYHNFLTLFAIYGFLISTWGCIGSLFFSVGKQSRLVQITVVRLVLLTPFLYLAYQAKNPEGVLLSLIVTLVMIFPLTYYFVRKVLY